MTIDGRIVEFVAYPSTVDKGGSGFVECRIRNTGTEGAYFTIGLTSNGNTWNWGKWIWREPNQEMARSLDFDNLREDTIFYASLWAGKDGNDREVDAKNILVKVRQLKPSLNITDVSLDKDFYRPDETPTLTVTILNNGEGGNCWYSPFSIDTGTTYFTHRFYLGKNGTITFSDKIPIETTTNFRVTLSVGNETTTTDTETITIYVVPDVEKICNPGERKCEGNDLYECSEDGTEWVLLEENSDFCVSPGTGPDFWTDPLGWIVSFVSNGFSDFVNWFGSTFWSWTTAVTNWILENGNAIRDFIADIPGNVQNALGAAWNFLEDWAGNVLKLILAWWESTSKKVQDWINAAVAVYTGWIDLQFKNIGEWWDNTKASIGGWWNDTWTGVTDFWDDITRKIGDWWDDTKRGIGDWWSDASKAVGDWIDGTFKNIGDWWNATSTVFLGVVQKQIQDATDFITSGFTDFVNWLNSLPGTIEDFIREQNVNIKTWVLDTIKIVVEGMFDWAKPVVQPIIDAVGLLGQIVNIFTGKYPQDPRVDEAINEAQQKQEEIDNLIAELD